MIASQMVLYIGGDAPTGQPGIHTCAFDDASGELSGLCCKKSGRDAMDVKAHLPVQLRPLLQTGWR